MVSLAVAARIAARSGRMAAAARRVAGGHYAERVPVDDPGELGELADSFNEMAARSRPPSGAGSSSSGTWRTSCERRSPRSTATSRASRTGSIAPTDETWRLLRAETGRLTRIVNDLSELWRAEARQLPLRIEAVDLAVVAGEVVDRFAPLAAPRGIDFELERGPAVARADRDRVAQILANYLSNALRHAPDGSVVTVTTSIAGGRVTRISVTDQGPGLAPDQLEAVFERFYRVDAARSRASGGSGIGLAIVRALADAMGGQAWAESAGPGTGATFVLELPAA